MPTQEDSKVVVVLGTGGTIAGASAVAGDNLGYVPGQIAVRALVAAVPVLAKVPIEVEQVAQLDSKDMDGALWRRLAERVSAQLARPDVAGVVVTHGTDTLEETAYLLQRVLAPSRPVVLTAAMRPATALSADGPRNLVDAVQVARTPSASGVLVVVSGRVHGAFDVRKVHPYRLDAFGSGDAGALGDIEEGVLRRHRPWPGGTTAAFGLERLPASADDWPWVEIVTSHAGARAAGVDALVAAGVDGLVVAGTGNGSMHRALEAALVAAQARGVAVLRSSRCLDGTVIDPPSGSVLRSAGPLTPVQARIELLLSILGRRGAAPTA